MLNTTTTSLPQQPLADITDIIPWLKLAKSERYQEVLDAIESGVIDPETLLSEFGESVWHYMALGGHYEVLLQAIDDQKFDPETLRDSIGATVWHYLALGGHYEVLLQAIDDQKFDPETLRDNNGATVWHYLAKGGYDNKLLLAIRDRKFEPETLGDNNRATVWHYLALGGNYNELIRAIDNKKFNPETLRDQNGNTVWHYMAQSGEYAVLANAVSTGKLLPLIDVDYTDTNLLDRFPKFKQYLIDNALKLPDPSEVNTWFEMASSDDYKVVLDAIRNKLVDSARLKNRNGVTIWHILASSGQYDEIKISINQNLFDPETLKTYNGATVWHYFAYGGHYDALVRAVIDGMLLVSSDTCDHLLSKYPIFKQMLVEKGIVWQEALKRTQEQLILPDDEIDNLRSEHFSYDVNNGLLSANKGSNSISTFIVDEPVIHPTLVKSKITTTGIANKYLNHNLLNIPSFQQQEQLAQQEYKFQHQYKFTKVNSLIANDQVMQLDLKYAAVEHAGAKFNYYTYNASGLPSKEDKVIFVFAGRGESALFPTPEIGERVVLVVTDQQFEKDFTTDLVENLDVLSISELKSVTHGDYKENIGTLNARRLAALIFSHKLGLGHCLCLDDNVEEILTNIPNINLYEYMLQAQQSDQCNNPVLLGMSTLSNVSSDITHNKFCAKIHFWDLKAFFAKLEKPEDLYFTAYPAAHSKLWGEDYLQQLMLQELFVDESRAPFALLPIEQIAFKRSVANRNSFLRNGGAKADELLNVNILEAIITGPNKMHKYLALALEILLGIVKSNVSRVAAQMQKERATNLLYLHAKLNNVNYNEANFTSSFSYSEAISLDSWKAKLASNMSAMSRVLKPHQQKAIQALIDGNKDVGRIVMATGAGKTMLQIAMSLNALQLNSGTPIIIVTPSMILVEQFYQEFVQKNREFQAICPTLACNEGRIIKVDSSNISAVTMCENKSLRGQNFVAIFCLESYVLMLKAANNEYLKSSKFILLDEYQEYPSQDLQKVYENAIANKALSYALSATPPKNDVFAAAEIYNYGLNNAIADRVVTPIKVKKLKSDYSRKKVKKYLKTKRLKKLLKTKHADGVKVKHRKAIIYLPSIEYIEKFKCKLNKVYPDIPVFAIHTSNSNRDEHLDDFKRHEGAAIALACRQMRVGFSDPKVYTVIYLQSGKEAIDIEQAAGRAVRIDRDNEYKEGLIICFADAKTAGLEVGPPQLRLVSNSPDLIFSLGVNRRSSLNVQDEEEHEFMPSSTSKFAKKIKH